MSTVADLLESKGRRVFSIDAEASVFEAIEKMVECDVAALVVTDANSELAGIISQRDFATKVVLKDESPRSVQVKDIMTKNVLYVRDDTATSICMDIMSQKNFHHLPVIEGHVPVAMVTAGDLFRFVVREQSMAIDELQGYIFDEEGGEG